MPLIFDSKKEIKPDTLLQRKPGLLFNQIDGEVVMLSIENSEYYGMNKVGSRIWELLEEPVRFSALIEQLLEEFNVSTEQCTADTTILLHKLEDKGLIHMLK